MILRAKTGPKNAHLMLSTFWPLRRDEKEMSVSLRACSHLECLSHSAASLMSHSRRVPLLLL